ncbi:hypothetical protein [Candidatus Protofrankia californiensis]|uniref:hypothetical protein n=1 Tax=Candidatus Protofrankia californiensis TaxID=1839754 RepID=UPI001041119D|nr:hypothetical protein [Candidatus Protofrankia californiensis]
MPRTLFGHIGVHSDKLAPIFSGGQCSSGWSTNVRRRGLVGLLVGHVGAADDVYSAAAGHRLFGGMVPVGTD